MNNADLNTDFDQLSGDGNFVVCSLRVPGQEGSLSLQYADGEEAFQATAPIQRIATTRSTSRANSASSTSTMISNTDNASLRHSSLESFMERVAGSVMQA